MTKTMTAAQVLKRLEAGPFARPAHVMLREVSDGTGARAHRRADGLVVSCWPSRGIWIGGIEVKVQRRDWLNELRKPEKSSEVQQYCDYWWVAAPPDVVKVEELPERWGFYELGAKVRLVKPAPKLDAKPLDATFVAAVLRNRDSYETKVRSAVRDELLEEMEAAAVHDESRLPKEQLVNELRAVRRERDRLKDDLEFEQRTRAEFEKAAGIEMARYGNSAGAAGGAAFRFAVRLANDRHTLERLIGMLQSATDQGRALLAESDFDTVAAEPTKALDEGLLA